MKKVTLVLLVAFLTGHCKGQDLTREYSKHKVYKNFRKALKNKLEVTVLDLSEQGLSNLPENIGELKNLKVLKLDGNTIRHFPQGFWQLVNLEVLLINRNKLDSLPERLGDLKNLKKIFASRNNLSAIPKSIVEIKGLKRLDVSFNKLSEKDVEFVRVSLPDCFVLATVIM
jgi:leucine-rich repeat protein SHOC2